MSLQPPDGARFDRTFVKAALEAAGATLICMPAHGIYPARLKAAWPEMDQAVKGIGVLLARSEDDARHRMPVPTARAIDDMDAALTWISLLDQAVQTKRLIGLRMMVNPLTGKNIWSYRKLEDRLGINKDVLVTRHAAGIDRMVTRLNMPHWKPYKGSDLP